MFLLFDLNGTLTDADAIGAPWGSAELGPAAVAGAVQTAAVDALTARYRPFAEHLRAAVEVAARGTSPAPSARASRRRGSTAKPSPSAPPDVRVTSLADLAAALTAV